MLPRLVGDASFTYIGFCAIMRMDLLHIGIKNQKEGFLGGRW